MGQYTISVKSICEMYNNLSDPAGFNDVETVIRNAAPKYLILISRFMTKIIG